MSKLKVYITGGDNCYCGMCGGVCDRVLMLINTESKTLEYIDIVGGEMCLGKHCWHEILGREKWAGWKLKKDWVVKNGKVRVQYIWTNGNEEIPVIVKNNKWGKDGEFGNWGICQKIDDEFVLVTYESYGTDNPVKTGWKFAKRS